ncbi:MAG: hypothetical protein MJZ11_03855 [Lachnospiraceae bacterium]|nr:hypothetical protein [Lachnospiraceae bacterium]
MINGMNVVTPIEKSPIRTLSAMLKCEDNKKSSYVIGKMDYEIFEISGEIVSSFQYVLTLYWDVIDYLPKNVFRGIPGYDLRDRKEKYYRVNSIPSFIKMRTPTRLRDDFNVLVKEAELDEYDKFMWLIKTNRKSSYDNLELIEYRDSLIYEGVISEDDLNNIYHIDSVRLNNMCSIDATNAKLSYNLYRLLVSGCSVYLTDEERYVSDAERKNMLFLLKNMLLKCDDYFNTRKSEGIIKAKEEGKFAGRKKKPVDPMLLREITIKFKSSKITEKEAMEALGIASRSTFFRRMKEVEDLA